MCYNVGIMDNITTTQQKIDKLNQDIADAQAALAILQVVNAPLAQPIVDTAESTQPTVPNLVATPTIIDTTPPTTPVVPVVPTSVSDQNPSIDPTSDIYTSIKPGYKTTEFGALVVAFVSTLTYVLTLPTDNSMVKVAMVLALGMMSAGYAISRGMTKAGQ